MSSPDFSYLGGADAISIFLITLVLLPFMFSTLLVYDYSGFVPFALLLWRAVVAGVQLDWKISMVHSLGRMQTEHKASFLLVLEGFHLVYATSIF